jgi:2-dehydropantoate 2-reductase
VAAVGRAAGVALPADAVEKTLNFNRNAPPHLMPSMGVDLLRGNRIELPWLSGKVVELGKKHGVPTPTHALMYATLKPYIMGKPA